MKSIGPGELKILLAAGGIDLVDVREPAEWATGHIAGARHVPLARLKADPAQNVPRDHVVFVCARGGRSATAAGVAEALGRSDVYSLEGGLEAWRAAGLDVEVPRTSANEAATVESAAAQPAGSANEAPPDMDLEVVVGANLRALRTSKGWSLDELAGEAGVSRTLLGQIENGRAPASIGVVWKLAQTMGVHFSALLSASGRVGTTVTRRADAKRLQSADGRFTSRALYPTNDPGAAEFYELYLAPHSSESAEAHRPGTSENLIVTAGQLELHFGGETHLLGVGDAIVFAADLPHRYVNPGREPCWMYLVMNYAR